MQSNCQEVANVWSKDASKFISDSLSIGRLMRNGASVLSGLFMQEAPIVNTLTNALSNKNLFPSH